MPPLSSPLASLSPEARRYASFALVALLAMYGFSYMRDPGSGHLIDGINLAIHETGHLVFAIFGDVIAALGGTLFQLIVPSAFLISFARRRDRLGVAVCVWWLAINCWNIAVYVADARAQELPLVGGGEHDWAYLLAEAGWLRRDQQIARVWRAAGFALYAGSLVAGARAALTPMPSATNEELASG